MISYLSGIIIRKDTDKAIINVAGVGYSVFLESRVLDALSANQEFAVFTHHYIREDEMRLYGFTNPAKLDFFREIIKVKGIGPQSAIKLLDLYSPQDIKNAIARNQPELIARAPGIGQKSAQRLIIELRNKIGKMGDADNENATDFRNSDLEAIEALTNLGYNNREVTDALKQIDTAANLDTAAKIKMMLKILNKSKNS